MNARNAFNPDLDERAAFPKLKADYGEDPGRFLQSSKDLAYARIRGIRDPELLTAYAAVAKQILSGSDQTNVLEAIDDRERELAGESTDAEPTPEPTPVPATDGGTTVKSPAEPEGSDEPDELHPDADGLEVGQVLVVMRGDQTEYVWPQTDAADEPFILRLFDAEGDQQMELTLSQRDLFSRIHDQDSEKRPVAEIDKRAPKLAATKGGAE